MARAVWTGALSFGLVNVPVALFAATEERTIRFNQFQAGTSDRVRNKRVNERTGEEVAYDDIVKGYDLGGGDFVLLDPEEIAAVAPGTSRTIDVTAFVELGDIDPLYYDRPYYLAPGKGGARAYALLRQAMADTGKVAVATFVMRDRQYLAAVRPTPGALVLETLRYADEVRDPSAELDTLPADASFEPKELDMARLLIDAMTTEWEPEQYHDTYRARLQELIEQKRAGAVVTVAGPAPQPAPVVDLLQALEASVQASRAARVGAGAAGTATAGRRARPVGAPAGPAGPSAGSGPRRGPTAARAVAPSGGRPPAVGGEAGSRVGKAELLRRAAELDITGRSRMSRDELERAVREAAGPRRRKVS